MPLLEIEDPPPPSPPRGFALFALGFRPLYLGAGAFAAVSILAWVAQFAGWIPAATLAADPLWHAHEMIFGFALAVIVGFLFTAGRTWAGQATPTGGALALIVALWLAARIFAFTRFAAASAAADVAFALAAAAGLGLALWRGRNRRNYFFVALLVAVAALNAAFHLALAGRLALDLSGLLRVALDLVLFIAVVMAGRVVPMFTNNAIAGAGARRVAWIERVALGSVLALAAADLLALPGIALAVVAGVAALAHGARLALWRPWVTRTRPILWILHAAYAWIVLHLALRAAEALGLASADAATHALKVGGIGGLIIGMMTRTARGHTARPLVAGRAETIAYVLVMLAAVVRVFGPLASPAWTTAAIVASGVLWFAAFALFAVAYWPILTRPRLDGKPG